MGRMSSTCIFVSHSPRDRAFAETLTRALRDAGAEVWQRQAEGPDDAAEDAIRACSAFLVVLSSAGLDSSTVREDCALAYILLAHEPSRRFITVMAPGYGPYETSEAIARALRALRLTPHAHVPSQPARKNSGEAAPLLAEAQSLSLQLFSPDALSRARQLYERATRLSPDDMAAWAGLGDLCALLQRDDEALAAFEHALALAPGSADLWCDIGAMRARLHDHRGALAAYERALALDPDSPRALEQSGRMLVEIGRAGEAVAAYDAALARNPEAASLWHARGNALSALERHAEAIEAYERALVLWPHFSCAWRDKATALHALGRHAEAHDAERRATGWAS